MRIPTYILGFGLLFSAAAIAQNPQQQPTTPVNPTTPANQVGDGAQSKSGAPVAPTSTSPAGGVAGAASSSTAQTPDAQSSNSGMNVMADSDLQGQIQNALTKEPTLTGDSPHVTVSGDTIELAGSVKSNKEKITASRIVQSYAGSKKLVNNLTINGQNQSQQPVSTPNNNSEPDKSGGTAKPPQK